MGNDNNSQWKSQMITKEFVEETISKVNNITTNILFIQMMKIKLIFSINVGRIKVPFVKSIIKTQIYLPEEQDINNETEIPNKIVHISLTDFMAFADRLNGNKEMFYENKMYQKMKSSFENKSIDKQQDDTQQNNNLSISTPDYDNICPICDEKKIEIILECRHAFCEKCIETWLFDKKNSCPMCRIEINISNSDGNSFAINQWVILENDKNMNETCRKDNYDSIENFIQKWFR